MNRILAASQEVRERRDQLRHPVCKKPELLAQAPNEVWSWDITKLMGPAKWTYFYLYGPGSRPPLVTQMRRWATPRAS
jgi:putative transposase